MGGEISVINAVCPHCNGAIAFPLAQAGRSGSCAQCGKSLIVPLPSARGPREEPDNPSAARAPASHRWACGVVLAGLLLSLAAALAFSNEPTRRTAEVVWYACGWLFKIYALLLVFYPKAINSLNAPGSAERWEQKPLVYRLMLGFGSWVLGNGLGNSIGIFLK